MIVETTTEVAFEGPFAARANCRYPQLGSVPAGMKTGIYAWTVQVGGHFRVAYLGKTCGRTRSFRKRIDEEVDRFMTGADGYFDLPLFRRGIRKRIACPEVGGHHLLSELIDCSPIFVAPVECDPRQLLVLESAMIRTIQSHSMETNAFLAHGRAPMRQPLLDPVVVRLSSGLTLEGLERPIR